EIERIRHVEKGKGPATTWVRCADGRDGDIGLGTAVPTIPRVSSDIVFPQIVPVSPCSAVASSKHPNDIAIGIIRHPVMRSRGRITRGTDRRKGTDSAHTMCLYRTRASTPCPTSSDVVRVK